MLTFNENKVTLKHFDTNYIVFNTFYRYLITVSVFWLPFCLHFSSFWTSWIRIRIPNAAIACVSGSGSETLLKDKKKGCTDSCCKKDNTNVVLFTIVNGHQWPVIMVMVINGHEKMLELKINF
jgi:hypothetical protein